MKSYEKITPDSLFSWLTPLHIDCLSDAEYAMLRQSFMNVDIQSSGRTTGNYKPSILPEYESLNGVSKLALKNILATAITKFTDKDLEKVFWETGMPFPEMISDKREFLRRIWGRLFPDEQVSAFSKNRVGK